MYSESKSQKWIWESVLAPRLMPFHGRAPRLGKQRAFTLIELIGVMTVLSILALALTPVLIKQLDRIAGEKESNQLKSFAGAFRQGVVDTKSIPNQNGWYSIIATNLGLQTNQVVINDRKVPRVFLIDPNLRVGGNSSALPYSQAIDFPQGSVLTDGFGNVIAPASPRVMIVSSISKPIPLASGVAASFDEIWNMADGGPLASSLSGYTGKPDDLMIQRIHLSDMFIQVILNNQDFTNQAQYLVEGIGPFVIAEGGTNSNSAFFIDGTFLTLFDTNGIPQYTEILHENKSFVFGGANWNKGGNFGPTIHHPDPVDLQLVADAFLGSGLNPSADPSNSPTNVYALMIRYMSNYVTWADAGFPAGSPTPPVYHDLIDPPPAGSQRTLAADSADLIHK